MALPTTMPNNGVKSSQHKRIIQITGATSPIGMMTLAVTIVYG
jgi:hypothetical protein